MPKHTQPISELSISRIRYLASKSDRTLAEISLLIGQEKSYLSGLFVRPREPGAHTIRRLANLFGVSIDFLLGFEDKFEIVEAANVERYAARLLSDITGAAARLAAANGERLNFNQILEWWRGSNRMITGSSDVEEQFDLINVPNRNDSYVVPHKVGKRSMAGTRVGHDRDLLERVVLSMPKRMKSQLVSSYYEANQRGENYTITPHRMVLELPEIKAQIPLCYDRLLLPVTSADGRKFILSHCYPASENGAEFQGLVKIATPDDANGAGHSRQSTRLKTAAQAAIATSEP